jgi:hypothetical protein
MDMSFGELLEAFKKEEGDFAECIMPVIDDADIRNGVLAWQSMLIDYDVDSKCPHQDSKRQWEWMWNNIQYDVNLFSVIAKIEVFEANKLVNRLRAYRLIYPDGTSNNIARAYLRQVVSGKLPKKPKKEEKN